MLSHLYDQSICSVLVRCLNFEKKVFQDSFENTLVIRNSIVLELVRQHLAGTSSDAIFVLKELTSEVIDLLLKEDFLKLLNACNNGKSFSLIYIMIKSLDLKPQQKMIRFFI
jgi:hypothetical protein